MPAQMSASDFMAKARSSCALSPPPLLLPPQRAPNSKQPPLNTSAPASPSRTARRARSRPEPASHQRRGPARPRTAAEEQRQGSPMPAHLLQEEVSGAPACGCFVSPSPLPPSSPRLWQRCAAAVLGKKVWASTRVCACTHTRIHTCVPVFPPHRFAAVRPGGSVIT